MARLSPQAVLSIWEQAPGDDPVRMPLSILAHAWPDLGEDELLGMSIGERDRLLLDLRRQLFGEQLNSFTQCPSCGERLEFVVAVDDLQGMTVPGAAGDGLEFQAGKLRARLHPPDSHDLLALQACTDDAASAAQLLLQRCVEGLTYDGRDLAMDELAAEDIQQIGEFLSRHQAPADVAMNIECAACGHDWAVQFDIASFFASELQRHATQLLDQVHALALAYGWQEQHILAMHPQRRRAYLERVLG